ncbi:MAG: type II toxin-antitoxin system VapC family toxin [Anaerolineae bacterium]|nr:type II toxin-antitoxin system VapC family toxin [Anaerolineae bacterium]
MNGESPASLLDTNIFIALQRREPAVLERLAEVTVHLSVVVLGELYYGARHSGRAEANLSAVETLAAYYPLLVCDKDTAKHYARIRQALRAKGQPIPENDLWIAAQALQHGLVLVTRDSHFEHIDGLAVQSW